MPKRLALLCVLPLLLSTATFGQHQRSVDRALPSQFHGIWVTEESLKSGWTGENGGHVACPPIRKDEDAYGIGEGVLVLRRDKLYSQETDCKLVIVSKICCDAEEEDTRGGTIVCGRNRTPVIFHLRKDSEELIVAEYDVGASGPSIKKYRRCKS
jgi:hypothetical protein